MPIKKTAYVICCNDSVEAVVLDGRKTESTMNQLAERHRTVESRLGTKESYYQIYYWHIHEVPLHT